MFTIVYTKLKVWKEESNLTYGIIAERSGIPVATVQKIISGDTQNPSSETIYKICKALGHTMEELYDGNASGDGKEERVAVAVIREMYESRLAEIKANNELHINDLKESYAIHSRTQRSIMIILSIVMTILFILFLAYFVVDYSSEHWGLFFR